MTPPLDDRSGGQKSSKGHLGGGVRVPMIVIKGTLATVYKILLLNHRSGGSVIGTLFLASGLDWMLGQTFFLRVRLISPPPLNTPHLLSVWGCGFGIWGCALICIVVYCTQSQNYVWVPKELCFRGCTCLRDVVSWNPGCDATWTCAQFGPCVVSKGGGDTTWG